ncbi:MAG: hypothetical protein PF444_07895, partial [Bacteroidales bacterium]|nr:hypothetical protein [Bacteroidales bacterium]
FRDWQKAKGKFIPMSLKRFKLFLISAKNFKHIAHAIQKQKYSVICLNDTSSINKSNFSKIQTHINGAFDFVLPQKSSFEL